MFRLQYFVSAALYGVMLLGPNLSHADQWWERTRTTNIRPGEVDYPKLNPHPTQTVNVTGTLPDSLQIVFQVLFAADARAGSLQDGNYCGYKAHSESFPTFNLIDGLKIVSKAGRYEGDVIVDKYLPDRCGWHLEFVGYKVRCGAPVMSEGYFAGVYDASRAEHRAFPIYRGKHDIWCRKMTARAGAPAGEQCESLSVMRSVSGSNPISPKLLATIPTDEYLHQSTTIWILPETRAIEVNFHDLDAMERELPR
jgi:hypothetical protein